MKIPFVVLRETTLNKAFPDLTTSIIEKNGHNTVKELVDAQTNRSVYTNQYVCLCV